MAENRTVVVTGANGFLGRRVVSRLGALGHPVRALVRPGTSESFFRTLGAVTPGANIEVHAVGLRDDGQLAEVLDGVGAVLHLAASTSGPAAAQVANTVVGSSSLFEAATKARTPRFVLVSSLGVLATSGMTRHCVLDESAGLEPHPERRDPYTFAKVRQEQLAWRFHRERGLPLVVLRPGVIFGPGRNLLSNRIGLSLPGLFLHLGGGNTVPMTFVDNCADALVCALLAPDAVGEAFCVVDDDLPTSRQILRRYKREVAHLRVLPLPFVALRLLGHLNAWYSIRTAGHLPPVLTPYKIDAMWKRLRFSNQKARAHLGWAPRVAMSEALRRTLADQPSKAAATN